MPPIDNRSPKCYICGMNKYGLQEYSFEIGPIDDSSETVAIVGIEYSSVSEDEKFYRKEDVDNLLAGRDADNRELKRALWLILADLHSRKGYEYSLKAYACGQSNSADNFMRQYNRKIRCENRCRAKADEYRVEQFNDEGTSKC